MSHKFVVDIIVIMPKIDIEAKQKELFGGLAKAAPVEDDPSFPESILLDFCNKREFMSMAKLREYVVMIYESKVTGDIAVGVAEHHMKIAGAVSRDLAFVRRYCWRQITLAELRYLLFVRKGRSVHCKPVMKKKSSDGNGSARKFGNAKPPLIKKKPTFFF